MKLPEVNDSWFLTMNPFPSPVSSVKHKPKVVFDKQIPRDDRVIYAGLSMSDSLYQSELRSKIRP